MGDEEIDTKYTDYPTCPYCGYVDEDICEMDHSESESDTSCGECGKNYRYSASISVSWNTYKAPCLNGSPHEWSEWGNEYSDVWRRKCEVCGKREHETRDKESSDDE